MFYEELGGDPNDFREALLEDLRSIRQVASNFRTYTDPGQAHCILAGRDFYTHETDGASLLDWVADLAVVRRVRNVGLR